jgi:predicted metal-dependent phosphoesterase TrpH
VSFADLHMHTLHSDGEWVPAKLVRAAVHAGLGAIAVTDHDDVRAFPEATAAGEEHGIAVLSGVELSTWWEETDLHLLAYGFDPGDGELGEVLARARSGRRERAKRMARKLTELGVGVTMERVTAIAGDAGIGRPHVARALVEAGHVPNVRTAFDLYLGDGKPACVEKVRLAPEEAVRIVHAAGGVVSVAHPVVLAGGPQALERLLDTGVDGVEVRHTLHGEKAEAAFLEFARAHGLLRTGGSDFHGPRPGGPGVGAVSIPRDWWEELLDAVERIRGTTSPGNASREGARSREGGGHAG